MCAICYVYSFLVMHMEKQTDTQIHVITIALRGRRNLRHSSKEMDVIIMQLQAMEPHHSPLVHSCFLIKIIFLLAKYLPGKVKQV